MTRNGGVRVDHPGTPCASGTRSYAAPNAKLGAGDEVLINQKPPRKNSVAKEFLADRLGEIRSREMETAVNSPPPFPDFRYGQWLFQGHPAESKLLVVKVLLTSNL